MNHDGLNKWHEAVETPPFPAMNSKSVDIFARPQGKDQHRDACPKQPDHARFRNRRNPAGLKIQNRTIGARGVAQAGPV